MEPAASPASKEKNKLEAGRRGKGEGKIAMTVISSRS